MNDRDTPGDGQTARAFQCSGCGASVALGMGAAVISEAGSFPSCHSCRERALRSPRFRAQFSICASIGQLLPHMQAQFAKFGITDLPTNQAECHDALDVMARNSGDSGTV